jgi:hypothetical protein
LVTVCRDSTQKGKELAALYDRLAKPTSKSICVQAKRNGDYLLEPVLCSGFDMDSVRLFGDHPSTLIEQLFRSCEKNLHMSSVKKIYDDQGRRITDFSLLHPSCLLSSFASLGKLGNNQLIYASSNEKWLDPDAVKQEVVFRDREAFSSRTIGQGEG